jgi:hypothetical protein
VRDAGCGNAEWEILSVLSARGTAHPASRIPHPAPRTPAREAQITIERAPSNGAASCGWPSVRIAVAIPSWLSALNNNIHAV